MARFVNVGQFSTTADNTQGVCFDDDFFYISEASKIMKYTRAGAYVDEHDTTPDGINHHLGDLMIKDGILYVMSSSFPTGPPYNENVKLYNADDLSFITYHETSTTRVGEGIDYHDGKFWTVSNTEMFFYRWDGADFTDPVAFPITEPDELVDGDSTNNLQTLVWVDDDIYTTAHHGSYPHVPKTVLRYHFDGTSFTLVEQIKRPEPELLAGQGMAWNSATNEMYFAIRNSVSISGAPGPDSVVTAIIQRPNLAFSSFDPIDKVVQEGEVTIVNDGDTIGTTGEFTEAKIVESTATNTYGRAGLIRARWSVDGGTNYQALESELVYSFDLTDIGTTIPGLDAAVSIGCSDSTITFRTANGKHGNVTGTGPFTYTPTSQTFLIEYALYERE